MTEGNDDMGDGESKAAFPATIYHYCPTGTFLKILESKAIWLSDIRHMSDYKEGRWAYELIEGVIKERSTKGLDGGLPEVLLRMFEIWNLSRLRLPKVSASAFHNEFEEVVDGNATSAFIACFSEEGDLLSQWRAYADDGLGVTIGFDPESFGLEPRPAYVSRDPHSAIGLAPVVYDSCNQRRTIEARLERYLTDPRLATKAEETAAECAADLGAVGLTFKNPSFSEEREWRIIHTPMRMGPGEMDFRGAITDVHYRVSGGNVVAYFPFSFAETADPAIKEVVLGP
ncbi:MAG: DUF2971 domain-containing protein, partial [Rhodospirillales bacterium]|nr:DUF2971 domain-containing protein [Rhodospirillales bacterium]